MADGGELVAAVVQLDVRLYEVVGCEAQNDVVGREVRPEFADFGEGHGWACHQARLHVNEEAV